MVKEYFKEKGVYVWVDKPNDNEFRACLNLRGDQIFSDNPIKRHKTSQAALKALQKEIKEEIIWLENQLDLLKMPRTNH